MEEKLQKDYPWLFVKNIVTVVNGKKSTTKRELSPNVQDCGSHWRVYKEKDSSPLILSKSY